ncbi:ATP-dependent DNA helicase [Babesia caballi]|uniref:ATP-dependent DNA helicase n=1 Tax=Babesia caballi TaxID=5871 RepID=A0AAV4LT56_BABCB|nr:ATP-dependent DNA helicase [Babesia caballi]
MMVRFEVGLTPFQHGYRKRYRRIAQPMRRNVGRRYAGAGDFTNSTGTTTEAATIIPNELLKSLGQTLDQTTITQSLLDLSTIHTYLGTIRFNFLKKLLNLFGQFIDGLSTLLTTLILPILPRHPQDPVYGLSGWKGSLREFDKGG